MTEKVIFIGHHYLLLGVFITSALGLAWPFFSGQAFLAKISCHLVVPLAISTGLGILILALAALSLFGYLSLIPVMSVLGLGLLLSLIPLWRVLNHFIFRITRKDTQNRTTVLWWWTALISLVALLPLLLLPLRPPQGWDELSYHLPYARFWVENGGMEVNEWLRYPLLTFNMNLLYSAGLIIGDDIIPHLLHAAAGALTAYLVYACSGEFVDYRVGFMAAALLLLATGEWWGTAYVDLGFMLFWTASFVSLALRYRFRESAFFSYLAGFLAGIALGIKYQALIYIPLFILMVAIIEHRRVAAIKSMVILIAVGGIWYLGNLIISGDPIHPLGGKWLGFWLWNEGDLVTQYNDLKSARDWPEWYLMASFASLFIFRDLNGFQRAVYLLSASATILWYFLSGYPRYLYPIYPLMSIMSASALLFIFKLKVPGLSAVSTTHPWPNIIIHVVSAIVLMLVTYLSSGNIQLAWNQIFTNPESRNSFLANYYPAHAILKETRSAIDDKGIYQLGFENEIYFFGMQVKGDWFGPARYEEVMSLSQYAMRLADHLHSLNCDYFMVNLQREPFAKLIWAEDMVSYFDVIAKSDKAIIYRVKPKDSSDTDSLNNFKDSDL